jgi:hypothetical protein
MYEKWVHNVNIIFSNVLKIWENYITELYDQPNQPENLEVQPEEEVDAEKAPYIL